MYKLIIFSVLGVLLFTAPSKSQVIVKWSELNKNWVINSGGYPADEPTLDTLYYKLVDFKLSLAADSTYKMSFKKDSIETGRYSIDKKKKEITFMEAKKGEKKTYTVAELTPDILLLIISEKLSWAHYISLTSNQ